MINKYVIGVDVGTQSTRVIIFDATGETVSVGRAAHKPLVIPKPGWAEHPDNDIWEAFIEACKDAFDKFSGDKGDIKAIGLTTQRSCRVLVDKDGELMFPIISWLDRRTYVPIESLDIYKSVYKYLTLSGYLTKKLTGNFNDNVNNQVGIWPIDFEKWKWSEDPESYVQCNTPPEKLANLQMPGTILGYIKGEVAEVTGLPEGLPVVAGAGDKQSEMLGGGAIKNDEAFVSCGTFVGLDVAGEKNIGSSDVMYPYLSAVPWMYNYEANGVRRGFWMISWFCEQFGKAVEEEAKKKGMEVIDMLNKEAEAVSPGCEGLVTICDWAPPTDKQYRKGIMLGFDGRHTRAHIFRSILEGIALSLKKNFDALCNELDITISNLNIGGGGSKSTLAMQIFADVFDISVKRLKNYECCSLGSAIAAAVGAGIYPNFEEAVEGMVHVRDEFQPNTEIHKLYTKLNEKVYSKVHGGMDPVLENLSEIFDK